MKKSFLCFALAFVIFAAAGCDKEQQVTEARPVSIPAVTTNSDIVPERIEFAKYNTKFRFSGTLPAGWQIEYVPEIESINLFNPNVSEQSPREQSQIFIRYFKANDFLTLSTVDVLNRKPTTVGSRAAVEYEIKKKPTVSNFREQPGWRNSQHKLIDIRFSQSKPSLFYVFAYNPNLPKEEFDIFIQSLDFHNDISSLHAVFN